LAFLSVGNSQSLHVSHELQSLEQKSNERNFSQRHVAGLVGGPNFTHNTNDKKSIVHTLSWKRVFFWGIF